MPDLAIERSHWAAGRRYVAGVDEAGRGCLAGPVVAAAVVLPPDAGLEGLDDSKKLSPERRAAFFDRIRAEALAVGVGLAAPEEVDRMNVLRAALEAMRRAVADLALAPDVLLVDGNQPIAALPCPQETVVQGDTRCLSIAAASVVAKVTRDRLMVALHEAHPHYGWAQHKGYPTPDHYAALAAHGPSPHHRRSFRLTR
jgi:ribonuclease HII